MEVVEGKVIQPVPDLFGDRPQSMVMWKARVLEPGQFSLRVRSSTGLTQAKAIRVTKEN